MEEKLDFSERYTVKSMPGIAFRIQRYVESNEVEWILDCEEDHDHDGICFYGEPYTEIDYDMVVVVMVGDDYEHIIDVSELSVISEEDYCGSCGQIGCGW